MVENAFGHLKARFRRVGKGLDNHMVNTRAVIKACVNEKWIAAQQIENETRQLPENVSYVCGNVNPRAGEIRQAFVSYFGQ